MTCRGYDPKAIKVPKSVKRLAATLVNNEQRRGLIKSYAKAIVEGNRLTGSRRQGPSKDE
jgi:hypothetical protein